MGFSKTIAGPVALEGVGVHTGRPVRLRLLPAERPGILFRRIDLDGAEMALAPDRVESQNSTTLVGDRFSVRTVEHLLAAFWVPGIDALVVELDADEIPILDGSAEPFAKALQEAGISVLPHPQPVLRLVRPFRVEDEAGASIEFSPIATGEDLDLSYTIVYDHPAIRTQSLRRPLRWSIFLREIAPARTFGFMKDLEAYQAGGLALGSSVENTVALDETGVMNGPLRFPDEFVRHKLLDLTGDLALLGRPFRARVAAEKAGHRLHLKAVRHLFDHPELVHLED
ncbi:MAG: UDP-3-O-[3-hydroxymyristoyl] N-acetylglucosamine deacetylase [Candidatus Aminicenantes bacterium]|nr:UDP-3-O-[3-hydroxymyristoyl] N-acetylglucosamine deacetylase [Candidatus Aminicenantes bacterium]